MTTQLQNAPGVDADREPLLEVRDLTVTVGQGSAKAVDNVSFSVRRGERVGIVGESGSGKTVTAKAISRLIENQGGVIDPASVISLAGTNLTKLPAKELQAVRAQHLGMIFQDPLSSLNPVFTVGNQIVEAARNADSRLSRRAYRQRAVDLLGQVGIPDPSAAFHAYPHEFSGGMRQRAMIAIALACEPALLIADEPTTALDVTVQAQILSLLDRLVDEHDLAVLLITHDFGVVSGFTDRLYVMYSGSIIEEGNTSEILDNPAHAYTAGLVRAVPDLDRPRSEPLRGIQGSPPAIEQRPSGCHFHPRCPLNDGTDCVQKFPELSEAPTGKTWARCHHADQVLAQADSLFDLVETPPDQTTAISSSASQHVAVTVANLQKTYASRGRRRSGRPAVRDANLELFRGETLGIVGESGSGKSTLARCVLQLEQPDVGSVRFFGSEITGLSARALRSVRRDAQMVFQDPYSSLDSRRSIRSSLAEPMKIHGLWGRGGTGQRRLEELMETVHLDPAGLDKYPHEFSGGQLQRVAIARALALEPKLIVFDEPVSSLDVSTQAQVITFLEEIQQRTGMTYLFIAHDLAVVRHISDRIAVVHEGDIVEVGSADQVCHSPTHPYTQELLAAVPRLDSHKQRNLS